MNDAVRERERARGHIELICGSMFSGKTEELIRRLRRAEIAKQRVQVFSHRLDTRHGESRVASHSGANWESLPAQNAEQILERLDPEATVVAIDEAQFFNWNIAEVVNALAHRGVRVIVTEIEPVIMFNEVTVLDGGANSTTALAMQECVTWNISHANFQTLLQHYPMIGLGLLRVLAARTRNLMAQYEDLSFRSVFARTAKLLLDLSARGARPIQRKEHPNADLAARISTVPEALSRSLQVFRKNGDIACTRVTIIVNQPETLEEFAQVEKTLFKG